MLNIYGTDSVLIRRDSSREKIRISPLFQSKIRREKSCSGRLDIDANVIISGIESEPVPQSDRIFHRKKEWHILSVHEICNGVFELELKQ